MYKVEVITSYEEIYRYTTTLMCEGLDASLNSECVVSADDGLEDGGEFILPQSIVAEVAETSRLRVVVYILCHTVPAVENVDDAPPFEVMLRVSRQGTLLYEKSYMANQWAGLTLDVVL